MSNAIPLTSFDLDELKSRINPAYANIQGTESYERRLCVEEIDRLKAENHTLKTERDRLYAALEKSLPLLHTGDEIPIEYYADKPGVLGDAIRSLKNVSHGSATTEPCHHDYKKAGWDEVTCLDCGWIVPSGPTLGPNDGWFPSHNAYKEFKKYNTYPGIHDIKPTRKLKADIKANGIGQ